MAACLLVSGCLAPAPELPAPVTPPVAFSASGDLEAPDRWWTAFGDPALDRLVETALAANLDLAGTWERLRQARAVAARQSAGLLPTVDGSADGRVTRRDGGDRGDDDPDGRFGGGFGGDDEELQLGLAAAYEVDLWGRIGSRAEAAALRAEATAADHRTAALSLSAEVARTWFQRLEAAQQVALLEAQIEADETVLRLLRNRFGSGQIRGVDVVRQRQLVEATREQWIAAEARRAVLGHQLAVLLGRPPRADLDDLTAAGTPAGPSDGTQPSAPGTTDAVAPAEPRAYALPSPPPLPSTGVPAELVRRRPDVRAAYLRLGAADRDLAAAVADRYPRLTLTASLSTAEGDAADLFTDWTRSLAAGLLAPLFRGGELAAEVDRAEAVRREGLLLWGQATLVAFREVEDALVREAKQAERVASLERQAELTETAYEQLRLQFFNGLSDYIDVLTARTEAQRVGRDLVAARRVLLEERIALYRALAGGFDTPAEAGPAAPPPAATPSATPPSPDDPPEDRP